MRLKDLIEVLILFERFGGEIATHLFREGDLDKYSKMAYLVMQVRKFLGTKGEDFDD